MRCSPTWLITALLSLSLIVASACSSSPDPVSPEDMEQERALEQAIGEDADHQDQAFAPSEDPHAATSDASTPEAQPSPEGTPPPTAEEVGSDPASPEGEELVEDPADIPQTPGDVDEEQVQRFAAAYAAVMDLQYDYEQRLESAPEEEHSQLLLQLEEQTLAAVEEHQLSIDTFNAIAELLAHDVALRDRIQAEIDSLTD